MSAPLRRPSRLPLLWLLPEAWLALWQVRLALWTMPWPRFQRFAAAPATAPEPPSAAFLVGRLCACVRFASRFTPRATCLVQAVAARRLLARRNIPTDLRIGVRKRQGRFDAHAWLTWQGRPVLGAAELDSYREMPL